MTECEGGPCQTCTSAKDCGPSPTVQCNAGMCEDPTWGCLGKADPRGAASASGPASLKVKVLYAFAQGGALETGVKDLTFRLCAFDDALCDDDTRLVTTDAAYGADNVLTINGLEAGRPYRLQLRGFHPDPAQAELELLPTEYLMVRTVVGDTIEPEPILMFEDAVRDSLGSLAEVPADDTLGTLLMRTYACNDATVAGVQVVSGTLTVGCMGDCPTTVIYQGASNVPRVGATETDMFGRAAILNMKTDEPSRIKVTRAVDKQEMASFVVTPRANWITFVSVWPWDYATAAD